MFKLLQRALARKIGPNRLPVRLRACRRLNRLVVGAAVGFSLLVGSVPAVNAALNTGPGGWVMGMTSSGSLPFNAQDPGGGDTIVRTHDHVVYRVGFTTTGGVDTNSLITLQVGGFSLPGTYTGVPISTAASFSLLGIPTGASGCQNISTAPVADPPPVGTSGITADGQKLFCYASSPSSGSNMDFRVEVSGQVPNGTTLDPIQVSYVSDQTPIPNTTPEILDGPIGSEVFYGTPALNVAAEPRWNLHKGIIRGALFIPGSGPSGEDGFVFGFHYGVFARGSRKGLEALASPITINDSFSDTDFPNALIVNWDIDSPGYADVNFSAAGPGAFDGCGNWNNAQPAAGNVLDNRYHRPRDMGSVNSTNNFTVAHGGDCRITGFDNTAKTASFEVTGTDFSLTHYPTKRGGNPAAADLINPVNPDDPTNEWWVANKSVIVWAPVTDVAVNSTEFLTNTADLSGNSVTGQANVEPLTTDNAVNSAARRVIAGSVSKRHTTFRWTNPYGLDLSVRDPVITGDAHVNQVAPNQLLSAYLIASNSSTEPLTAGQLCDRIDNTRLTYFDATDPAYVRTSGTKDPATGIIIRPLSGPAFPLTIELGVGGTGTNAAGTWNSFNTTTNEYSQPPRTGSAQSDSDCGDADATWYPSVAAVLAAEGANGLEKITRVRFKYNAWPAGGRLILYIPQIANGAYTFASSDNAPGGPFAAGDSTNNQMAVNQLQWSANFPGLFGATGVRKVSDAVRIFQNEYARISKTSATHAPSGALISLGDVITYDLTVNLTTSGSTHQTTVDVWDVLPDSVSLVTGSSTLGGAPIADPTCVNSGLPTGLFPAQTGPPAVAAGSVPPGYLACRWTLPNQTVTKTAIGNAAGNLPVLQFRAQVGVGLAAGTLILNTAFADSTDNGVPSAIYGGANQGFVCKSGQACSFSNWQLIAQATPGIALNKQVNKTIAPANDSISYTLSYSSVGSDMNALRILDVLPYNGDGRLPATSYSGTIGLASPILAPVASGGSNPTTADPNFIALYSNNTSANINSDPYDAGHDLTGSGVNSATSTNWCTQGQLGSPNCPTLLSDVTAVLMLANGAGPAPNTIAADQLYQVIIPIQTSGNALGDRYTNGFIADSPSLTARRPSSNYVTTDIRAADLVPQKAVIPTGGAPGAALTYSISVRNGTGIGVGPIQATPVPTIRVTDTLPGGVTIATPAPSGTDWDCTATAGNNVDCSYTGPLPLGVGATVGGQITVNATIAASAADGASIQNTTSVSMTGQPESPTTNNTASATVTVTRRPDLTITKAASAATVGQGLGVNYTLGVTTVAGEGVLTGGPVTVTDNLPGNVTISGASDVSGTNWDCSASSAPATVSCLYTGSFPLPAGSTVGGNITVNATVAPGAPLLPITNTASVTAAGETNLANNDAMATITVIAGIADVSGMVYHDTAANGAADGGADPGIQGIGVTLCSVNTVPCPAPNIQASTTTNASGQYVFAAVPSGNWFVIEDQPAGFGSSTNNVIPVTRVGSTPSINNDFGETLGRMGGFVYADNNSDGTRDPTGENGVGAPVSVTLSGNTINPQTGATVALSLTASADPITGAWEILNVPAPAPGTTYTLTESPGVVTGYTNGSTNVGTPNFATGSSNVSSGSPDDANSAITGISFEPGIAPVTSLTIDGQQYNFGEQPQAGVSGRVYLDTATNGNDDAVDPGIGNVVITLCTVNASPCPPANVVGTSTTATDGTWQIPGVPPGSYFVIEDQPTGYGSTTANIVPVTRTGSTPVTDITFGESGAQLSGQIYVDEDYSSTRNVGDTNYTAATGTVTLTGTDSAGTPVSLSTPTNATGGYAFNNLRAPDSAGYTISVVPTSYVSPFFAAVANPGTVTPAGGSATASGSASGSSTINTVTWVPAAPVITALAATADNHDFGVIRGVSVSGRVMRDVNQNGTGNATTDPADQPVPNVTMTLCLSATAPCPPADVVQTQTTASDGTYTFAVVAPGNYFVMESQPNTLGNGPGAVDIEPITVSNAAITDIDFLDRPATVSGQVYRDNDNNGVKDSGEPGIAGVTITLTGTDIAGNPVSQSVTTDANGLYQFDDLAAPDANGYTVTESNEPPGTADSAANPGTLNDALGANAGTAGTATTPNVLSNITVSAGGSAVDLDFGEAPTTAGVGGRVWRDADSDRTVASGEQLVAGWTVQLRRLNPNGTTTLAAQQLTDANGAYRFIDQTPGNYQIVFLSPTTGANGQPVVWGTPVNGEQGSAVANSNAVIANGIIQSITLLPDQIIEEQSLPLDPSGVVYDAISRQPVQGAQVTLNAPAGFDPNIHLIGGAPAVVQTTGPTGEYQYLLTASAPPGPYWLDVLPPAGYSWISAVIPPENGTLTPPTNPAAVIQMVPSPTAPQSGEATTYYLSFDLTPGTSSGVVHNHIPLDPDSQPALFVSKQADRGRVELGDSVKYTVRLFNRGANQAPALTLVDALPPGFKYIAGTARVTMPNTAIAPLADPSGGVGPNLVFNIPGSLPAESELQVTYRVRAGAGSAQGDGINRVYGATGSLRSAQAQARVLVTQGVFTDDACIVGKVFTDCNNNHTQDAEEIGVPGVRIYMEDGRYIVTDSEGKYSMCGVSPMTHVLKVDKITLPRGSRLTGTSNRNAGDAGSLFVDLKNGDLFRADFALGNCSNPILEQVRARRARGEVNQASPEPKGGPTLKYQDKPASAPARSTESANQPLVIERDAVKDPLPSPATHVQDEPVEP